MAKKRNGSSPFGTMLRAARLRWHKVPDKDIYIRLPSPGDYPEPYLVEVTNAADLRPGKWPLVCWTDSEDISKMLRLCCLQHLISVKKYFQIWLDEAGQPTKAPDDVGARRADNVRRLKQFQEQKRKGSGKESSNQKSDGRRKAPKG